MRGGWSVAIDKCCELVEARENKAEREAEELG